MSIHQRRIALAHLIRNSLSPASLARGSVSAIALGAIAMSIFTTLQEAMTDNRIDSQEWVLVGLGILMALEAIGGLPFDMPRSWYQFRILWFGVAVVSLVAGFVMLKPPKGDERDTR